MNVPTAPLAPQAGPTRVKLVAVVCFALGCAVGFCAGVLSVRSARDFVAGAIKTERPADVTVPKTVDRPAFRFQHAANWRVDVDDADYDPDHNFSVDSPGQSFAMFVVADGALPPEDVLEKNVDAQTSKIMKGAARTPFTRWGTYTGHGMLLTGKHLGITPGTIRIFCFRAREQTFTVIESTYDDDRASVQPGFELIERTFHVEE